MRNAFLAAGLLLLTSGWGVSRLHAGAGIHNMFPPSARILRDYGQDAVPLTTDDGASLGLMRHVVKVFLVDEGGAVRNVYSIGFLDHRLLLRDVETLLLTDAANPRP